MRDTFILGSFHKEQRVWFKLDRSQEVGVWLTYHSHSEAEITVRREQVTDCQPSHPAGNVRNCEISIGMHPDKSFPVIDLKPTKGWYTPGGSRLYQLVRDQRVSWIQASAECQYRGGELATLPSQHHIDAVRTLYFVGGRGELVNPWLPHMVFIGLKSALNEVC